MFTNSKALFEKSQRVIPGGVNSPVRAFKSVGGTPVVVKRAKGPYFWDLDGNRYIDYVLSWGPLILGHAPQAVLSAIQKTAAKGTSVLAQAGNIHQLAALEKTLRESRRAMEPASR